MEDKNKDNQPLIYKDFFMISLHFTNNNVYLFLFD